MTPGQDIKFRISADGTAQTASGVDSVRAAFARLDDRVGSTALNVGNLGAAVGRVASFAGIGGGLGVASLVAFASSVADGVDGLNDLHDATGSTVEMLSALEDVALRSGSSMDVAGDAVVKLNKALNEAAQNPKSGPAQVIRELGLSVDELRRMDPVEALQQISIAFEGVASDGEKGRYLLELTGKSVRELAPLMKDLAEAGALNAKVTGEQAEQAEKLNKRVASLRKDLLDLARSVAIPLVEALNHVADGFRDGETEAGKLSDTAKTLAVPLQALAVLGAEVAFVFKGIGTEIGGIAAQAAALARGDWEGVKAIRREMQADAEAARRAQDTLVGRLLNTNGSEAKEAPPDKRRKLPPLPDTSGGSADKPRNFDESQGISSSLQAALRALDQTDAAKIAEINAQLDALFTMRASGLGGDIRIDQAIAKLRDELEALDPVAKRARDAVRAVDELLGVGPDSGLSRRLDQMQELNRRLDEGRISTEAYIDALEKLDNTWRKTGKEIAETGKSVGEEIGLVFSSAAGEAITHWQGFRNLLKGIALDLAQIALKKTVTDPLGKALGSVLDGFDFGSILKSLVPQFATGIDYVPHDMLAYIHQGERVVRADENRAGGAGGERSAAAARPLSITFNLPPGSNPDDWRRSERQIQAGLQRTLRRAGAIA